MCGTSRHTASPILSPQRVQATAWWWSAHSQHLSMSMYESHCFALYGNKAQGVGKEFKDDRFLEIEKHKKLFNKLNN
jgi:hypothetical protein